MKNTSQVFSRQSALCLILVMSWVGSFAQSFNTNGNASYLGGLCYELTPDAQGMIGSIFSNNVIDLNEPFYIEAMMNFGNKDGAGADGIVFILGTNPEAIG